MIVWCFFGFSKIDMIIIFLFLCTIKFCCITYRSNVYGVYSHVDK